MSILIGVGVTCLLAGVAIGISISALMMAGKLSDIEAGNWPQ